MSIWKKFKNDYSVIKFTDDFHMMLSIVSGYTFNDDVIGLIDDIYNLENNGNIETYGITKFDVSDRESHFLVTQDGEEEYYKIRDVIFLFIPNTEYHTLEDFIMEYNDALEIETEYEKTSIKLRKFKYEPLNVRETFLSLVTETYPMGYEDELVPYLPPELKRDKFGNYYYVIGNSDTAFACHLDTASRNKTKVNLIEFEKDGDTFIGTDGSSILGADDKAGVTVLMYMMAKKIPGVYWFFYGEERGGQGSSKVANDYDSYPFMKGVKKIISFDRRNYFSVVTNQMRLQCCSDEFGKSLADELGKSGLKMSLDPTGVFTDSAIFVDIIPECVNVSVGYFNEHTGDEIQNLTFLEKLCKACVKVNWSGLTIARNIMESSGVSVKYARFLKAFKRAYFYNDAKHSIKKSKLFITLKIVDYDALRFVSDVEKLQSLLFGHKLNPDINYGSGIIKIELN